MAFVYELVSNDANVAVDEAGPDGQVVLVPKVDGRFARIGVVAVVEGEPAMLPGGHRGVTLRVLHRAELGRADASGGALRIDVTERPDSTEITEAIGEQMRAYRAVIESILEARDRGRVIAFLRSVEEPGALAHARRRVPAADLGRHIKERRHDAEGIGQEQRLAAEYQLDVQG
jgi:ATP-dependent Lon protease